MKKALLLIAAFMLALITTTSSVHAGGDQVQGALGKGTVSQEGPCPFGGDTPAGPNN